jgi:hypothetical protein
LVRIRIGPAEIIVEVARWIDGEARVAAGDQQMAQRRE